MEERKNIKYPIKYAIMPIQEQVSWFTGLNELEPEYAIVANIVSKCYIISEKKSYLDDGTYNISYEVVFPYILGHSRSEQRLFPEFNLYHQCTNSISVDQLFDSFEEASIIANKLNDDILYHEIGCLPFDKDFKDNIETIKIKHQETLNRYKEFENRLKKETDDMEITRSSSSTLEDVIEKIVESPREFYIKLADALSLEEREHLKTIIETKSCDNCTSENCKIENSEETRLEESEKAQGNKCLSWSNPELVGRQKISNKP